MENETMSAVVAQTTDSAQVNTGIILQSTGSLSGCAAIKDGRVYVWGKRPYGKAGNSLTEVTPSEGINIVPSLTNIQSLSVGAGDFIHALGHDGKLYGWGHNSCYKVGRLEPYGDITEPVLIMGNISKVSSYTDNGYAIDKNGAIYSWGANLNGELGLNQEGYSRAPQPFDRLRNVNIGGDKARVVGCHHGAITVTNEGRVWAWGINTDARLGVDENQNIVGNLPHPVRVPHLERYAQQIIEVRISNNFGVALLNSGQLIGWGNQAYFGVAGHTGVSPEPVEIMQNVIKVHCTRLTCVVLTSDGAVYTFGSQGAFYLSMLAGDTPTMRLPAGSAVDIGGGFYEVYYTATDGKVYGVGHNHLGQIDWNTKSSMIHWPGVEIELNSM